MQIGIAEVFHADQHVDRSKHQIEAEIGGDDRQHQPRHGHRRERDEPLAQPASLADAVHGEHAVALEQPIERLPERRANAGVFGAM